MKASSISIPAVPPRATFDATGALPRGVRAGLALALAAAVISGFSIFVNSYAVKEFHSASVFSSLKNAVVGAVLLLLFVPSGSAQLRRLTRRQGAALLALGVVGGSVPFILFFEGLSRAGAANAGFLQKTLFLWVGILAVPLLRERLGRAQVGAIALLLLAQWMIGAPRSLRPDAGETMVFASTLLWALEVIVAKRVLGEVGSQLGATARMAVGAVLLLGYVAATGGLDTVASLSSTQWAWLLGTSVILLAYVITWYAALERAPATAVTSILAIGAPITAALNAGAGRGLPTSDQLMGFALVAVAATLLIWLPAAAPATLRSDPVTAPGG